MIDELNNLASQIYEDDKHGNYYYSAREAARRNGFICVAYDKDPTTSSTQYSLHINSTTGEKVVLRRGIIPKFLEPAPFKWVSVSESDLRQKARIFATFLREEGINGVIFEDAMAHLEHGTFDMVLVGGLSCYEYDDTPYFDHVALGRDLVEAVKTYFDNEGVTVDFTFGDDELEVYRK